VKRLFLALLLFTGAILILRRLAGALSAPSPARPKETTGHGATELVRDRVCNTHVPKDRALQVTSSGETRWFCSEECRGRFLASARGIDAA